MRTIERFGRFKRDYKREKKGQHAKTLDADLIPIIEAAGGVVMSDTCPSISRKVPAGTRVIATDSAKQAHYLPAIAKVQGWFGSVEQCVNSAIAGEWLGVVQ